RFDAFLTNYYLKKPAIGAWICRIVANVIIITIRTELYQAMKQTWLCTLPHPAEKVFGLPRDYDMILERKQLD
ncbi:16381_t:CDS:2, partial [Racocetra persica]